MINPQTLSTVHFLITPNEIALASLIVSISALAYGIWTKRPKVVIENAIVSLKNFSKELSGKTDGWLDRVNLSINVEIMIANYLAQPGNITKPNLQIECTDMKLILLPVVTHTEVKDSSAIPQPLAYWLNSYEVRDGKAFSVGPYSRFDDELRYKIELDKEERRHLLDHYDEMKFTLIYRNHRGKSKRFKVKYVTQS